MRIGIVLALFAVMAGCATVPTSPIESNDTSKTPPRIFASPGESFTYVGKLFGIPAARVVVVVGDPGVVDGRRAVVIHSRASNDLLSVVAELEWELTTTLDLEQGLPLQAVEEARLDFAGKTDHERDRRAWRDNREHDVHSTVCMMRGWQAEPGAAVTLKLAVGGGRFPTKIWQAGRELVGGVPSVRFDGTSRRKQDRAYAFSVWISDDLDRVPLAMRADTKWGEITVELVEYDATRS